MTHHLKTLPEYFQAAIVGKKPFEIRNNDRGFKPGEIVILEEFEGIEEVPQCPKFGENCPKVKYDPRNEQEYFDIPEDCTRSRCDAYRRELYTGRRCLIKIKDVFELDAAGIEGYVAFTFEILHIKDKEVRNDV